MASSTTPMDERILDAADRLFYSVGIQAVGVNALAAEAGISKRTLYNHFPSKDELIAAYLARRSNSAPPVADGEPLAQILGAFDGLARWFASRRFRGCPFVNAVAELSGDRQHPAVAVAVAHKERRVRHIEAQLRALKADDPATLAQQIAMLFEGAIVTALVRGGDPQAAHAARAAACVLLEAGGVTVPRGEGGHGRHSHG